LAIAGTTKRAFEQLSAVTAGVKEVREVIDRARMRRGSENRGTILFLDEIHRFSKSQQDALLPAVEDGTLVLIGATTENPFFEVIAPLRSRSTLFRLEPLPSDAIRLLIERGLIAMGHTAEPAAVDLLVDRSGGDGRQVLTALEVAGALAQPETISLSHVESALGTSALRYGRDDHYDVVSAFIKSLRGSDPDAAIYWLARMLESGEDPKFIARRMIILASEDIGLADSHALSVAVTAAQALEYVGLPEAQLNLAHAALYLATAPKSNAAATAIWSARSAISNGLIAEVPPALRDAHYQGASTLGHGLNYLYPHDYPGGWVSQEYLPIELSAESWYHPTEHGHEARIAERLRGLRSRRLGEADGAVKSGQEGTDGQEGSQ
jgi:putative ATPase